MSELGFWPRLVLTVLVTWRITHLLAREDGPADVVARWRARLGHGFAGRLMDCFYCLSLWVAAPLSRLVGRTPLDLLLSWLALSGAACVLERIGEKPVVVQSVAPLPGTAEGETNNGMLWPEAGGVGEPTLTESDGCHPVDGRDAPALLRTPFFRRVY